MQMQPVQLITADSTKYVTAAHTYRYPFNLAGVIFSNTWS